MCYAPGEKNVSPNDTIEIQQWTARWVGTAGESKASSVSHDGIHAAVHCLNQADGMNAVKFNRLPG